QPVDADRSSDNRRIRGEARGPAGEAQHDERRVARTLIVGGVEEAPDRWGDAEDVEVVAGRKVPPRPRRRRPRGADLEVHRRNAVGGEAGEGDRPITEIAIVRKGEADA